MAAVSPRPGDHPRAGPAGQLVDRQPQLAEADGDRGPRRCDRRRGGDAVGGRRGGTAVPVTCAFRCARPRRPHDGRTLERPRCTFRRFRSSRTRSPSHAQASRRIESSVGALPPAPVRFSEQLDAMHRAGARFSSRSGPSRALEPGADAVIAGAANPVDRCPGRRRHATAAWSPSWRRLACPSTRRAVARPRDQVINLARARAGGAAARHVWMVSGGRARRQDDGAAARSADACGKAHRPRPRRSRTATRRTAGGRDAAEHPTGSHSQGGRMQPDSRIRTHSSLLMVPPTT